MQKLINISPGILMGQLSNIIDITKKIVDV